MFNSKKVTRRQTLKNKSPVDKAAEEKEKAEAAAAKQE